MLAFAYMPLISFSAYQKAKAERFFNGCLGFDRLGEEAVYFRRVKFTQQIIYLAESLWGERTVTQGLFLVFLKADGK